MAILEESTGKRQREKVCVRERDFRPSRLTYLLGPELVLQKQYRPPIDKVVIEVPAGLVDEGETAEEAAVRELSEERGYVGKVTETSPVMFNGQTFSWV